MSEIKNAKIRRTMLGIEDHGILTGMIDLDYGHSGQGFGGNAFDEPVRDEKDKFIGRRGTAFGMEFIRRVLEVLEVDSWEKLPGTFCRVQAGFGLIEAIGHPLKDKWFFPEKLRRELFPEENRL